MIRPRSVAPPPPPPLLPLLLAVLGGPAAVPPTASAQFGAPDARGVLADQLVAEAERLVEDVRFELAGTRQGRNLEIRGNALRGSAETYRNELGLRHADESRRLRAFDGVERSFAEVRRELNNPPGTAPRANASARRIDRIVSELRRSYDGGPRPPTTPPISPPSRPGYDWRRVAETAETTTAGIQDLQDRIDREIGRFHPYDGVLRDLDGMASGLDRIADLARRQLPGSQLGPMVQPIRNQSRRTDAVLRGARPPFGVARGWDAVRRGIDELARLLGQDGALVFDPNQPIPIDPPGFGPIPWPSLPGGGGLLPPTAGAVPLLDEAIGELDAYLLAIQPNLAAIPEGPQFHRDARELRNALLALRQAIASAGWNPAIGRQQREVDALVDRLVERTIRVGRGQIGPNNARILRVRDLVDRARNRSGPIPS